MGVLPYHLMEHYKDANIDLFYGYEIEPSLDFGTSEDDQVAVRISKCQDNLATDNELCDVDETPVDAQNLHPKVQNTAAAADKGIVVVYNNFFTCCLRVEIMNVFNLAKTKLCVFESWMLNPTQSPP